MDDIVYLPVSLSTSLCVGALQFGLVCVIYEVKNQTLGFVMEDGAT
jgi:hypothetical protein